MQEELKEEKSPYFAALDLGSNSFHLIVVKASEGGGFVELDKLKSMVRLGEGIGADKRLGGVAVVRALDALSEMKERLKNVPTEQFRAVGTNTMRIAANGAEFLSAAEAALGREIEIIGGIEEARLIYRGISSTQNFKGRNLVIDIGGGSTEIIIGEGQKPLLLRSIKMGCANMTSSFFSKGKITKNSIKEAVNFVGQNVEPYIKIIREYKWQNAITSSGTAKSVEKVLASKLFNPDKNQTGITKVGLQKLLDELESIGIYEKLPEKLGIDEARAFGFCGGVCILYGLFEQLGIKQAEVSQAALREGVLFELMEKESGITNDEAEITVAAMQQRFDIDIKQAENVENLANYLALFMTEKTPKRFARLLKFSCALHEIGLAVSRSKQQNHGSYLIENSDMPGFSQQMQKMMSVLIKGQRKKLPQKQFKDIQPQYRAFLWQSLLVLRLSVLLNRARVDINKSDYPKLKFDANTVTVKFRKNYLQDNPLTLADFNEEMKYWADSGIFNLKYE
ncbi:MAG: Ppx/GppA family phosphatase [Cardiobacteriaceae bacterium]|nr:Ppx/GppA family phosphatase [Cardiobacteriaceae bacterium]